MTNKAGRRMLSRLIFLPYGESDAAHHLTYPVFPANDQILTLAFHDASGQQVVVKEDLAERYAHLPDRGAELPGPLLVGGTRHQVVQPDDLLAPVDLFDKIVFTGIVGAAIQEHVACVRESPGQLELAVFVEDIQLRLDGVGAGAPLHDIHGEIEIGLAVDAGNTGAMIAGGDAHAALDPALENRPFDRVGIHHPAAQEAQVTVLDALSCAVGLILPMVQLELDRHEVIEDQGTLFLGDNGGQFFKKKAIALFYTLNLQRLGIFV